MRDLRTDQSGQMMLLGTALGLALMIGLAAIFFVNQIGTLHQVATSQRTKSRSVSDIGTSYIIQNLENLIPAPGAWQNALNGTFPSDCNSGDVRSPSGTNFRLTCTGAAGNPALQPYEIAVTAVAMSPVASHGVEMPLRAMQTYLAPRTLGVDLATGLHAAAALELWNAPTINSNGTLIVHWGPIVCMDSTGFSVVGPMDDNQFPRKISNGSLTGTTFLRSATGTNSDQKEYWAHPSITPFPLVDLAWYANQAKISTGITPPVALNSGSTVTSNCPIGNPTCGNFTVTGKAVFDAPGGYTVPNGSVVYVKGNVQFDRVAIANASFVIAGQLVINDSSVGNNHMNLRVPPTASLEYPFSPLVQPCRGQQSCDSTAVFGGQGMVQFNGFLYVRGYLYVGNPSGIANAVNWNMVGALFVGNVASAYGTGGRLIIGQANTASLTIAYDDIINHNIHMAPISPNMMAIEPDQVQDLATF